MHRPLLVAAAVAIVATPMMSLEPVQLRLTEIADSSGYLLYSYEVYNPAASTWSVAAVVLDVAASSGTPASLTSTGDFRDLTNLAGYSVSPHAEVGPIVPAGWRATLSSEASLRWYAPSGPRYSSDSIPPDSAMTGFGIRSSYLPGISDVTARPTFESCCTVPDTIEGEALHPSPERFLVTGKAVAPRYTPEEIDIDVLQGQLDTVCDDPLWIDDSALCAELADSLDAIEDRLAINNYWGAAPATWGARSILWSEQAPGGDVDWNAQWLLRTNLAQLVANFPAGYQQSNVRLCASSESATDAHFTVTSTGADLLVSSPVTIDAEVSGVDEPGSSCQFLWTMPLDATATVDVKIRLDSVSAGSELSEFGYDYSGTPVTGPDSIVTTHDGNTTAYVHFLFVDSQSPER